MLAARLPVALDQIVWQGPEARKRRERRGRLHSLEVGAVQKSGFKVSKVLRHLNGA